MRLSVCKDFCVSGMNNICVYNIFLFEFFLTWRPSKSSVILSSYVRYGRVVEEEFCIVK